MRRILIVASLLAVSGCVAGKTPDLAAQTAAAQPSFDTLPEKRAAFAQAYDLFRHGEQAQALPIFEALAGLYPALADYHLYFTGKAAARLTRDEEAEAAFSRLLRDYPESVKARPAALELGTLFLRNDRIDQARPLLQSALVAPDSATAHGARLALAEADEHDGDYRAAYAGFMDVRSEAVGSALGRAAKEHVVALRAAHPSLMPSRAELLDEARLLLRERDWAAAFDTAQPLTEANVDLEERSAALLIMAEATQGRGRTKQALQMFHDLADRFPATSAAPDALVRYAGLLWNQDIDEPALLGFEEFISRYPEHPKAPEALYAIARIDQSAGRTDVAIRRFSQLAQRYPHSPLAAEARWRIGWVRYLAHTWNAAAASFRDAAAQASTPRERNEALYWQSRALERSGDAASARELYREILEHEPNDYYAMWSERRLGVAADLAVVSRSVRSIDPPSQPDLPPRPSLSPSDSFHLDRWQELRSAGVNALGRGELLAVERAHRDDSATVQFLLRAYPTVDGYASALRLLRRGHGVALSADERERLLYPLAFWTPVSREARASAVDPLLVEAVMRQESMFDPEVRSPANAWGLLQLLPETAKRVARENGLSQRIDLTQPDVNVQLGTRYLNALLERFGGDPLKAIAAYNGGETAVEKWGQRFPGLEADEFVESISFRETRDYVKRVVANYRAYQRLYEPERGAANLVPIRDCCPFPRAFSAWERVGVTELCAAASTSGTLTLPSRTEAMCGRGS